MRFADGCKENDPDEVTFSAADLARIQEARDKRGTPAGPKAKKAKKSAKASEVPKKRGRGRLRQSDEEEEQDAVASVEDDEEEGIQSPRRKKVEEGGVWAQSVHGMSIRGLKM